MGNLLAQQKNKNLYLSGSQLLLTSSNIWSFQSKFLYHRHYIPNSSSNYLIVEKNLDLQHQQTNSYFEKLKMYDKFISKKNLFFPLMCLSNSSAEQCCFLGRQRNVDVKFFYEVFTVNLSAEIDIRQLKRFIFSEVEIWYILYNILVAIKQFQPFQRKSGRLNTNQVYMSQDGEIRIKNILYSPQYEQQRDSFDYFAPEEMHILMQSNRRNFIDEDTYRRFRIVPNICQSFSLGIIVIALTSLSKADIFYDFVNMKIIFQNIDYAMERTYKMGYSKLLTNLIKVMLSSYKDRPLPSQIMQIIQPYKRQILNLLPFTNSMLKKHY